MGSFLKVQLTRLADELGYGERNQAWFTDFYPGQLEGWSWPFTKMGRNGENGQEQVWQEKSRLMKSEMPL